MTPNAIQYLASSGNYDSTSKIWHLDQIDAFETKSLNISYVILQGGELSVSGEIIQSDIPDIDSNPNNSGDNQNEDDEDSIIIAIGE